MLSRLLRAVRTEDPALCPHRFHDKKAKKDLVYVHRFLRSKAKVRQRSWKRRFRRLHDRVCWLERIAGSLLKPLAASENFVLRGLGAELKHYLPLVRTICRTAERATLKGETVPARDRIFSLSRSTRADPAGQEQQARRVRSRGGWRRAAAIHHDYEVMERRSRTRPAREITERHKAAFHQYPEAVRPTPAFGPCPRR